MGCARVHAEVAPTSLLGAWRSRGQRGGPKASLRAGGGTRWARRRVRCSLPQRKRAGHSAARAARSPLAQGSEARGKSLLFFLSSRMSMGSPDEDGYVNFHRELISGLSRPNMQWAKAWGTWPGCSGRY